MGHYCHPGRYRMQSASLGIPITVFQERLGDISVETDDGVQYLPSEIKRLQAAGAEVHPAVHELKKAFGGIIEEVHKLTPQEIYTRTKYGPVGE